MKSVRALTAVPGAVIGLALLTACGSTAGPTSSSTQPTGSAVAQQNGTAGPQGQGKAVKVAIYGDAPPGSYVENGKLMGWVPEFTAALAKATGLNLEVQETASFDVLIPGLTSGRFDMSPALFYITPERLTQVDLISMSKVGTSFGVKKGSTLAIAGKKDLCGLTVATLAGSAFPAIIDRVSKECTAGGGSDIKVQTYPNNSAGSLAVINGRAQVYAATTDQLAYLNQQTKGALLAQPFIYAERLEAIALPKGSSLAPVVEAGVNAMIADGTYRQILKKWDLEAMAIEKSQRNPSETIQY